MQPNSHGCIIDFAVAALYIQLYVTNLTHFDIICTNVQLLLAVFQSKTHKILLTSDATYPATLECLYSLFFTKSTKKVYNLNYLHQITFFLAYKYFLIEKPTKDQK